MTDLSLILLGALLVNNFVLAQFLGLCPFMGIHQNYDTAFATGLATTFVLSLAAVTSHILFHGVLRPWICTIYASSSSLWSSRA